MTELRRALREAGVEYRVINREYALRSLAADERAAPAVNRIVIDGPTGVAFGYGEPTEPAKALSGFIRSTRSALTILGSEMDGRAYPVPTLNV
ncbi:50S ribosomal protein L10 [Geodia barretti]|nr:50S ribosomal protein L10 [Geodia barretti]